MQLLRENLTFDQAQVVIESDANGGKDLFMKGICIQGGVKNANQRVYPVNEIAEAVRKISDQVSGGYSVLGEVDHPDDLKVNLDRVSHMMTQMWMDGPNGYGKMKILPTPMGKLVETMLQSGVKLGVSSRGSGNVDEATGNVTDFEIVTVDVVAQPSAPNAYPTAIYEGLLNMEGGQKLLEIAASARENSRVQKYLSDGIAKPYIFEPNDKITRDEIKAQADSLMLELVSQRALYDFLVVCDESNNTPARIDRNELYLDIAIEPVKAVEFIYIPLRLKNTGEIAGL